MNFSMSYVFRTTDHTCGDPKMKSPGIASDIYHNHNVSAFFGPLCSGETAPVADLCAHWNIPMLSGASTSGILDNKNRYRSCTASFCLLYGNQRRHFVSPNLQNLSILFFPSASCDNKVDRNIQYTSCISYCMSNNL